MTQVKDIKNADTIFIKQILKLTKTPYGISDKKHKVPSKQLQRSNHKKGEKKGNIHKAKHSKPHKKTHISAFHEKVSSKRIKKNHHLPERKFQLKSVISKHS